MLNLIYSKLNALLGVLLTLLGFSSCGNNSPWNEVCEYGMPHANLSVKGKVMDESGASLEGIHVTLKEVYRHEDVEYFDPRYHTSSDAHGQYAHSGIWTGDSPDHFLRVVAEDPKGVYAADSTDVTLTHTTEGKDGWCTGTDKGTADFRLKMASPLKGD